MRSMACGVSGMLSPTEMRGRHMVEKTAQPEPMVEVSVDSGRLSGIARTDGLSSFLGVPYAAPPVGALRFRPPQPVSPWQGLRRAHQFGPRSAQLPIYDDMVFRSPCAAEDCLYLNIWTPSPKAGQRLPVLLYLHGGGFIAGDGSEPRYDGAALAKQGMVTVTVNYRLGALGFLAHPDLAPDSPTGACGNYGLMDQIAALRWVHTNIAAFGGDPQRVIVGGESAGAMSVCALLAAPDALGLIAGAIAESGGLFPPLRPKPLAEALRDGAAFAHALGASNAEALRALPVQELLEAGRSLRFGPVVDGVVLPQAPEARYAAGLHARIPLLVGCNSQEGHYSALLQGQPATAEHYRAALAARFGTQAEVLATLYPGTDAAQIRASATQLCGDGFIGAATWLWMDAHRRSAAPVYYYHYTRPRPAWADGSHGPDEGAAHSAEIEYALGNLDSNQRYAWTAEDHAVSRMFSGYLARFVLTGNPNGPGIPHWPQCTPAEGGLWRQTIDVQAVSEIEHAQGRYAFWSGYAAP